MNKITVNIINSVLAGALVLFGAFSTGEITRKGLIIAIATAFIVAITQFKDFFTSYALSKEETKHRQNYDNANTTHKLFNFINT